MWREITKSNMTLYWLIKIIPLKLIKKSIKFFNTNFCLCQAKQFQYTLNIYKFWFLMNYRKRSEPEDGGNFAELC